MTKGRRRGRPFGTPQSPEARRNISKGMERYHATAKKTAKFYETYGPRDEEEEALLQELDAHERDLAAQTEHDEKVNRLLEEIQRLKFLADNQPDDEPHFERMLTHKDAYRMALEKLKRLRGE